MVVILFKHRILILCLEVIFIVYKTSKETQKRKDEKRRQIIRAAARIFADTGYNGTTVKDIVSASGTSVGNFYFYFKSKEELFEILYDEMKVMLDRVAELSLGKKVCSTVEGFCRSKTSELWAFEHCKGLAKALMVEAVGFNPKFEKKRQDILNNSNERIEQIFKLLQRDLNIDNPKLYAIMCNGTMYSIIMDWLQGSSSEKLTDYLFQIVTYNLNAFRLEYSISEVEGYISGMISEMEENFKGINILED